MSTPKPIASRRLKILSPRRGDVLMELWGPIFAGSEWRCRYKLSFENFLSDEYAAGEDGFQAILMGFAALRTAYDQAGIKAAWLTGVAGDIGIPHFAPTSFGLSVQLAVELTMAKKTRVLVQQAKKTKGREPKGETPKGETPKGTDHLVESDK